MVTRFKLWFTLRECLFRGVKLPKNADLDKYVYSGYFIGFDSRWEFSDCSVGKNIIIFVVHTILYMHFDNEKKRHLNSWYTSNTRIT